MASGNRPLPGAWEGGLSLTSVGILISKSLGTFWILGSVKVIRPKNQEEKQLEKWTWQSPTVSFCTSDWSLEWSSWGWQDGSIGKSSTCCLAWQLKEHLQIPHNRTQLTLTVVRLLLQMWHEAKECMMHTRHLNSILNNARLGCVSSFLHFHRLTVSMRSFWK